ncbi:MAG: alpha/beta hydrolase-fold protein [Candidatus Latescibacteria bacterium]|jgi:predicted peptidase|nr:alpha/beta hydrolase-fold protein [Candidatus Latescibacterota bacterium]
MKSDDPFRPATYEGSGGKSIPYRLFSPPDETRAPSPLVVHMHGSRGIGTDNVRHIDGSGRWPGEAARVRSAYICTRPENQRQFACYVIAPQASEPWIRRALDRPTAPILLTAELIQHLKDTLPIDPRRVYVMGHSMGGHGTWEMAVRYPKVFAAAVPIGGIGNTGLATRIVGLPVWAFHVTGDPVISVDRTRDMIAAVRDAGGDPRYTEYDGHTHADLLRAYAEPNLLPWMFSQRR